jgi:DNA polymerase III subunit alpha
MKKHMKDLKPDRLDDLIAMNALYRPGPIAYIPDFIARKHGRQDVRYDLADMEEYLGETFGITVYQEQVMLLSQKLAGFSKGDADVLRKAMGKKDRYTLDKLKPKFLEGAIAKGHDEKTLEKVWTDWEAFASYAFNKSHSTCYAVVAYQTAYLKAHYPSEYMASVLTHNLSNIEKITFFMEECRALGLPVLGPDVNESLSHFSVNKKGEIRFGLGGIKGTGDAAVDALIEERQKGNFKDIFDFITRVNLRTVNKKTLESLAYSGAFDSFTDLHRGQYFYESEGSTLIEKLIKYANKHQENANSAQNSLFGSASNEMDISKPKIQPSEEWGNIAKLKYEKEVVGFYISGHPLDQFKIDIKAHCTCGLDQIFDYKNQEIKVAGIVSSVQQRQSKNGNPFAIFKIEDYNSTVEMMLFGQDYVSFNNYLQEGRFLFIRGKVQNRWGKEDDFEFKPMSMELLQSIRDKFTKEIKISLGIQHINVELVKQIDAIAAKFPGNCDFKMRVFDIEEKLDVTLLSRKQKV